MKKTNLLTSFSRLGEFNRLFTLVLLSAMLMIPVTTFGQTKELKTDDDGFKYYELKDAQGRYKIEDLDGNTLVPWQPEGYLICYQSTGQYFEVFKSGSKINYFKDKTGFQDLAIYSRDGKKLFDCTPYDRVFLHLCKDGRYFYEVYKDKKCAVLDGGGNLVIPFGEKGCSYILSSETNTLQYCFKGGEFKNGVWMKGEYADTGIGLTDKYKLKIYPKVPKNSETQSAVASAKSTTAGSTKTTATASTAKNTNSGSAGSSSSSTVSDKKTLYETYKEALRYYNNKQYTEAFKLFKKAAEQGQAESQFYLGVCYSKGYGVTQSYAEAVKWYRKAAEQGEDDAQFNLGVCYTKGNGVTQSYAEAVKWYRKAAEQGEAHAQFNLGICYANGDGVTEDYAEAVKWYRKAAEQEHANAQYNLGICYAHGDGVTEDYAEAVKWFRKAARQGQKDAQEVLRDLGETW